MTKYEKLAMDLALEALENFADVIKYDNEQDDIGCRACCYVLSYDQHSENCKATKAITAIKQALAAPTVQEPVAILKGIDEHGPVVDWYRHWVTVPIGTKFYTTPPAQPAPTVQEPVAWGMPGKDGFIFDVICPEEHTREEGGYTVPLYTTPPAAQRPDVDAIIALVRADEREACAQIAADYGPSRPIVSKNPSSQIVGRWEGEQAASAGIGDAIRARGNT
jgi:hypothetical protein